MKLQGKVAIITGISRDGQIGQSVAQEFARQGARLVLTARNAANLEARAKEVQALGAEVLTVSADLTQEAQVNHLVQQTLSRFGRIDILINLAGGLSRVKPAAEHTLEDWTFELNNNLLTAFLCSKAVFKTMQDQGGGVIVNFARAGLHHAKMVAYNCAKAGIEALTRTFAIEGRKHDIRVNAVAPGLVDTKDNLEAMKPSAEDLAKWVKREQIAKAVVFLASDEASGILGQVIEVPGKLF